MRVSRSLPVAYLTFFFNSFLLPHGLLYTQFLTPVWGVWLAIRRGKWLALSALLLAPFVVAHAINGVDDIEQYLISLGLLMTALIFLLTVLEWARERASVERAIRHLTVAAFGVSLLALALLPTPAYVWFWSFDRISANIYGIPRLSMLTYEASYLSTLLVPLWTWAFLRVLYRPQWRELIWLAMASVPLALSFSLGILSLLGVLSVLILMRRVRLVGRSALLTGGVSLAGLAVVVALFTTNPLSERLHNLLEGRDTSSNSRTLISLRLGVEVAELRDPWWGAGLGQAKVFASEIIRAPQFIPKGDAARLPNAIAETIVTFGWIGLALRLGLQLLLFWRARIWQNDYQLMLFGVAFLFQFMGSYLVNVAELSIWALAAWRIFPEFEGRIQPETPPA